MGLLENKTIGDREFQKFKEINSGCVVKVHQEREFQGQFQAVKTVITSASTKIDFPTEGTDFVIYHVTADENIWIAGDTAVAVDGANSIPLPAIMNLPVTVPEGNDNEFYGLVASGTVNIYVMGTIVE